METGRGVVGDGGTAVVEGSTDMGAETGAREQEGVLELQGDTILGSSEVLVVLIEEGGHGGRLRLLGTGGDKGAVTVGIAGTLLVAAGKGEEPDTLGEDEMAGQ